MSEMDGSQIYREFIYVISIYLLSNQFGKSLMTGVILTMPVTSVQVVETIGDQR